MPVCARALSGRLNFMMPLLFGLLLLLAVHNLYVGGARQTLAYLFAPDLSKVSGPMLLAAVGQAFFSIGVAMGGMMAFAAYLPAGASIGRSAAAIVCVDTLVAVVAGLVIFPAAFSFGLDPAAGEGLIFETLPVAFGQMAGGRIVGILFFLLLSVAAVTSMVGFLEPVDGLAGAEQQPFPPRQRLGGGGGGGSAQQHRHFGGTTIGRTCACSASMSSPCSTTRRTRSCCL